MVPAYIYLTIFIRLCRYRYRYRVVVNMMSDYCTYSCSQVNALSCTSMWSLTIKSTVISGYYRLPWDKTSTLTYMYIYHPLSTVSGRFWDQYGNPIFFSYLPSTSHTNITRISVFFVRKRVIKIKPNSPRYC